MSVIDRLRRQQLVREAEGYLDFAQVFVDQWSLTPALRDRLVQRSLAIVDQMGDSARTPHVQYIKGQALRMLEKYREALQPLSVAAEGNPRNLDTWLALGWCYKRTGRLDLAIESLEEALEIEPDSALVNFNLACYWSLARNKRQALIYLSQALRLDSSFRNLIEAEHDFDPMRADPEFQTLVGVAV